MLYPVELWGRFGLYSSTWPAMTDAGDLLPAVGLFRIGGDRGRSRGVGGLLDRLRNILGLRHVCGGVGNGGLGFVGGGLRLQND